MSHPLPTVRVKTDAEDNPDGYYLINESDFDDTVHERHESDGALPVPPPPPAPAPAENRMPIADLRAYLDDKGIAYDPAAKKADLQALYDADRGV